MSFDLREPGPIPTSFLMELVALILRPLIAIVGVSHPGDRYAPHIVPLRAYIGRTIARFTRLLARLQAGTLTAPRPRPSRAGQAQARQTPRLRLPRRHGWIVAASGWRAAGQARLFEHLLARPDVAGIVAAHPQAQRLLRPLTRMLGLTPACIPPLPPRAPRAPRSKPPSRPRRLTRREREAILWYPNSEGRPMKLLPKKLPRD